jgi:hypothetical protein
MDKEIEKIIVDTFFSKQYRDRILFELFSDKKRKDAIGRLSHSYADVLIEKYMSEIPKPNSSHLEIVTLLEKLGAGKECYVISFSDEIDGKNLSLQVALEKVVGFGMPSLVYCKPNSLAYFESEQCYGAPPRYILRKDR